MEGILLQYKTLQMKQKVYNQKYTGKSIKTKHNLNLYKTMLIIKCNYVQIL